MYNHERCRKRKLLLQRREIRKFAEAEKTRPDSGAAERLYARGFIKLKLGLCRGRKMHDKRENLKSRAHKREMDAAIKQARR